MKIGDVKVGAVLALDTSERYSKNLPRQVEVLQIVSVEESYWPRSSGYLTQAQRATRKIRRVEVKFLDDPQGDKNRYAQFDYQAEKKGAKRVVEAKRLIGPWSDLKQTVEQEIAKRRAKAEGKATTEARLEALFGKKMSELNLYVSMGWQDKPEVRFEGADLEHILTLAEAGLAAQS